MVFENLQVLFKRYGFCNDIEQSHPLLCKEWYVQTGIAEEFEFDELIDVIPGQCVGNLLYLESIFSIKLKNVFKRPLRKTYDLLFGKCF